MQQQRPRPETVTSQVSGADLREALDNIRRRGDGDELVDLLVAMLDAGEIEVCGQPSVGGIREWKAVKDSRFIDHPPLMQDEGLAAAADLFLWGMIQFTVDTRTPPEVVWSLMNSVS